MSRLHPPRYSLLKTLRFKTLKVKKNRSAHNRRKKYLFLRDRLRRIRLYCSEDFLPTAPVTPRPANGPGALHRHETESPSTDIPTAPPSPRPEHKPGVLRRHDTFFFLPNPPHMDIPTAPPSPRPEHRPGILRRHDTFWAQQRSPDTDIPEVTPSPHPEHGQEIPRLRETSFLPEGSDMEDSTGRDRGQNYHRQQELEDDHIRALRETLELYQGKGTSDSLRDTLNDCYEEILLQSSPPQDIPEGISLERYVTQTMNHRRLSDFLALAWGHSTS
ncbi:hypothetical protein F5880DRAFT_1614746 [Lentinula raphanica]|nr:hypothetical protein F5880DRAFT_1614746 [Lentinula raphanica]